MNRKSISKDFKAYLEMRGIYGDEVRLDIVEDYLKERCGNRLPPLISVADAAEFLGITRDGGYKLVRRNQLPVVRFPDGRIKVDTRKFLELYDVELRPVEPRSK